MPKAEKEKELKKEYIYKGKYINVRQDTVELASGKPYEQITVEPRNEVTVLAQLPKGKTILVKQYRRGPEEILLELPGGKRRDGEDELSAVAREFEEETGYRAKEFEKFAEAVVAPGWSTLKCSFFLARGLEPVENPKPADPDENIEVVETPFKEALSEVKKGGIKDVKTAFGLLRGKEFFSE